MAAAVLSALSLCGCVSSSASRSGTTAPAIAITDRCERLLAPVPLPAADAKTDARVAFMRDEAALITANGRLDAGRNCIADVRRAYAGERPDGEQR